MKKSYYYIRIHALHLASLLFAALSIEPLYAEPQHLQTHTHSKNSLISDFVKLAGNDQIYFAISDLLVMDWPATVQTEKHPFFKKGSLSSSVVDYPSVTIGRQVWMAENLNVDRFRNGDPIPEARTIEEWNRAGQLRQPAWCYFNNDPVNGLKHGKLYNWYAVNDPRGLAPQGWHVPTTLEWEELIQYLGGESAACDKIRNSSGWPENGSKKKKGSHVINASGLSLNPSGGRFNFPGSPESGEFRYLGREGAWWSSSEGASGAWLREVSSFEIRRSDADKACGISVRCVRD